MLRRDPPIGDAVGRTRPQCDGESVVHLPDRPVLRGHALHFGVRRLHLLCGLGRHSYSVHVLLHPGDQGSPLAGPIPTHAVLAH